MKYCKNCGQPLEDNASFCGACGTPANADSAQPKLNEQPAPAPAQPQVINGDPDVQQNRGIAWLAYVGLLLLVPLFARKKSEYCQFHVKQGATLLALEIVYTTVTEIFKAIIRAVFPGKWIYGYWTVHYQESVPTIIFTILFAGGSIFLCVLAIIGLVNAATGKKKDLPLIGKIPWISMLMDKIYAALNK